MSTFKIAVFGIFGFSILVGMVLFATYKSESNFSVGKVVIWGTIEKEIINDLITELKKGDAAFRLVKYVEKDPEGFNREIVEALAEGIGPDIFILPQDSIVQNEKKIILIPYESISLRDFKDKFIEEGELYLSPNGIIGLPFTIDPMVMYWNRDIFQSNGISNPPLRWEEFFNLSQNITEKDNNLNIKTSFVAFGEFRNIKYAKEIISALVIQAGSPIVKRDGFEKKVVLDAKTDNTNVPAELAIDFYTQFSNPVKSVYTWNRGLTNSERVFVSGDLAIYFGFAGDLNSITKKNPNLDFDVAPIPQTQERINTTFGKMNALSIAKGAKNVSGAYSIITKLTNDDSLKILSEYTNLPPVSRTLLSQIPANPYQEIFYRSALSSKAWLDPDPEETNNIFQNMIESILAGREKTSNAVRKAASEIRVLME